MTEQYIKLSDLRKVSGIGEKTIQRIKETLLQNEEDNYISEYNPNIHLDVNNIYNGDCLELMNGIPDKSIDMILCDLPYGTTQCKWDTIIPFDKLWKQYNRVIKDNGAIVLFGSEPFGSQLINSNLDMFKYELIWDKVKPSGHLNAKIMPLKQHENLFIFGSGKITYNPIMTAQKPRVSKNYLNNKSDLFGDERQVEKIRDSKYPKSIIANSNANQRNKIHPTQKPVDLLEYLIKTYTNEGDVVLDNCIGSGTTAIATINTNRNYIGIELEKEYFDIAVERIKTQIK